MIINKNYQNNTQYIILSSFFISSQPQINGLIFFQSIYVILLNQPQISKPLYVRGEEFFNRQA